MGLERNPERQAILGVVQVEAADLGDAPKAIEQRVAVDVQRLGGAMAVAKAARTSAAVEPWRFAVARIQRMGIDAGTWTPSTALWSAS